MNILCTFPILVYGYDTQKQKWYDVICKCIHTFPKDINQNVNVMAQAGFEIAYYEDADYHSNLYATETLPNFYFAINPR